MGLPGDEDARMNLRRTALTVVLGSLYAAAGSGVAAQDDPVKWSAKVVTKGIRPGGAFDVAITAVAEEDWHVYSVTEPEAIARRCASTTASTNSSTP